MTLAGFLAPPSSGGADWFHLSGTTLIIIVVVVVLGGLAIFGWRAPDRSPHKDEQTEREREE
jgi:predicted negative regulator of RcsB-dependent stress response